MEIRFREEESEFSGELVEYRAEYVDANNKMDLDYNLNQEQKRQYPHRLLCKDAARFYATAVEAYAATS